MNTSGQNAHNTFTHIVASMHNAHAPCDSGTRNPEHMITSLALGRIFFENWVLYLMFFYVTKIILYNYLVFYGSFRAYVVFLIFLIFLYV